MTNRAKAVAAGLLVAALGLGYWGYGAHQQRQATAAVLELVADTAARLRDGLGGEAAPPPGVENARFLKALTGHAATAERNLQALKRLDARAGLRLADAADDYILTAREILKRQAEARRQRLLLEESSQALRAHMRADNRTGAWVQEAVQAKERVNRDYRGYAAATGALDRLLGEWRAAERKMAPHLAPGQAIPATLVEEAGRRVREKAAAAAAEFETLQQLAPR